MTSGPECPSCAPARPLCACRSTPSTPNSPTERSTSSSPTTSKTSLPASVIRPLPRRSPSANESCGSLSRMSLSGPTRSPSATPSRSVTAQPARPEAAPTPTRRAKRDLIANCVGGVRMPPWGVPVVESRMMPSSPRTPACRNAFTTARTRLSPTLDRTRSIRAGWSIMSKEAPTHYPCRGPCGGVAGACGVGVLRWRPPRGHHRCGGGGGRMTSVVVTRRRHPLEGLSLRELGRMRRHGRLELLLVLPDGSKSLIPAAWTDLGRAADSTDTDTVLATLGSLADLLAACVVVADLVERRQRAQGQAAGKSPCKEDAHAACPAQFDTRSASEATGAAGGPPAGGGGRGRDHAAGRRDRQDRRPGGDRGGRR